VTVFNAASPSISPVLSPCRASSCAASPRRMRRSFHGCLWEGSLPPALRATSLAEGGKAPWPPLRGGSARRRWGREPPGRMPFSPRIRPVSSPPPASAGSSHPPR
jgi:hypothetical protein